jgi:hypothetical protein
VNMAAMWLDVELAWFVEMKCIGRLRLRSH